MYLCGNALLTIECTISLQEVVSVDRGKVGGQLGEHWGPTGKCELSRGLETRFVWVALCSVGINWQVSVGVKG